LTIAVRLAPGALGALVFSPALAGGFVHDDRTQIVGNPLVKSLAHLPEIFATGAWAGAGATTCSQAGNSADRSCTHTGSVTNGANDNVASANVRAQASADHGITTNPTASADITVTYDFPYTVTRTFSVSDTPPWPAVAAVPIQSLSFDITFSGSAAKDNSQIGGGLGQATVFTGSLQSLTGKFTTTNYTGAAQTGGGGLAATNFTRTTPDPSYATTPNFSGAAVGEISFVFQVPTDYRMWTDDVGPLALDYANGPQVVTQSFTDTLRVTFRLRAESRPSGSISTTGGEALACAGQTSPLGAFDLDNQAAVNCGSGFTINALSTVTGTENVEIAPEPAALGLLGLAMLGLAWVGYRKHR
jgi:hypothetical protein